MEFFQCSSSSANNDDYDGETLLKKLCALLCVLQNECIRMHLRTHKITKISWGSIPLDPLYSERLQGGHVLYFS